MREEGRHATRFRRRLVVVLLVAYSAFVAAITLSPRMPGSGTVASAPSVMVGYPTLKEGPGRN